MGMRVISVAIAVAAAVEVTGCGKVLTMARPVEQLEIAAPDRADDAVAFAVSMLEIHSGVVVPRPMIRWYGDLLPVGEELASGITYSCNDIWVWIQPGMRIAD